MSGIDVWKDAPEGTEFIVEFTDGEIHYYKTVGVTLCVCTNYNRLFAWKCSYFEDLNDLIHNNEYGRKQIHHKQNK